MMQSTMCVWSRPRWIAALLLGLAANLWCPGLGHAQLLDRLFKPKAKKQEAPPSAMASGSTDGSQPLRPLGESLVTDEARQRMEYAKGLVKEKKYRRAFWIFRWLHKHNRGTPIEEDAMFAKAECLYEWGYWPAAQDAYSELLNKYPTSRHLPHCVQRLYDMGTFWLEDARLSAQGKKTKHLMLTNYVNVTDSKRPSVDSFGRAVEALELVDRYDPFGPLTGDALMLAAAHVATEGNYLQAAGLYEQLVADQPKNKYAGRALMLGAQSYLRAYQGPNYDGQDLENAERLVRAALTRSVGLTQEELEVLKRDERRIYLERARRDYSMAELYYRRGEYVSCRYYCEEVIKNYSDTEWARRAERKIQNLDDIASGRNTHLIHRFVARLGISLPTPKRRVKPSPALVDPTKVVPAKGPTSTPPAIQLDQFQSGPPPVVSPAGRANTAQPPRNSTDQPQRLPAGVVPPASSTQR